MGFFLFKDADYCRKLFISPDFPACMKEIITGPKFPDLAKRMPYLKEQLEILCRAKGMDTPGLTMSAIEYK